MTNWIMQILFPNRCFYCKDKNAVICSVCLALLEKSIHIKENGEQAYTFLNYQNKRVRKIIWELKYKNNIELRKNIISILNDKISKVILENTHTNTIVYVPIPKTQSDRKRDFNHTQLLAKEIKKINQGKILSTNTFIKIKNCKRQVELTHRNERIQNAYKSIKLGEYVPIPKDSVLCIIDDVLTTGATNQEMRRILHEIYPNHSIFSIILAH